MSTNRRHLYSIYERIWHWLQALGILMLMLTGLVIHWPDLLGFAAFSTAVAVHNVLGFLLVANAFLGLFYHITTGAIRQYLPEPHDFVTLSVRQAAYYVGGMFRGEPHPLERTSARRLNPLQQVTYLIILNVLLPLQLVTGLSIWAAQHAPDAVSSIGGLGTLAMIHTLVAWLFAAFVVMHVYLTTTGETPLANLKAMILGYEDVVVSEGREPIPVPVEAHCGTPRDEAAGPEDKPRPDPLQTLAET